MPLRNRTRFPLQRRCVLAALLVVGFARAALPATVTLLPEKDNTLYENPLGNLSNGAGEHLFTGRTRSFGIRRALLAFDVDAAIPSNAVITSVELSVFASNVAFSGLGTTVSLFLLTADWGEGTSKAAPPEGAGAPAQPGEATWLHRFSPGTLWTTPGGDFAPQASATTPITAENAAFTWTSSGLVNDVQGWLANPTTNFGWIMRGNETATTTAIQLGSRTNPVVQQRPQLTVEYNIPEPAAIALLSLGLLLSSGRRSA